MVDFLLWLLVVVIVISILFWVTGQIDQPYQKWIRIVLAVLIVIYLLYSIGALPESGPRIYLRR